MIQQHLNSGLKLECITITGTFQDMTLHVTLDHISSHASVLCMIRLQYKIDILCKRQKDRMVSVAISSGSYISRTAALQS